MTLTRGLLVATKDEAEVPTAFALGDNYPNPFNPETTIPFDVKEPTRIVLEIYDLLGKRIATLVDRSFNAGRYYVPFEAKDLPSGLYLYRIQMGDFSAVSKMMLLK